MKKISKKSKSQEEKKDSIKLKRFIATVVDWYLASVVTGIPILLIYSIESGDPNIAKSLSYMSLKWGIISGILAVLLGIAYYVLIPIYWKNGQTLGKRLVGIKVTNMDGSNVNIKNLCSREILGAIIIEGGIVCSSEYIRQMLALLSNINVYSILSLVATVVTGISIILLFKSKDNRMIHDYIAKTKVVEFSKA